MYWADHITTSGAMRRTKAHLKSSNPPNPRESRKTTSGSCSRYRRPITTLTHTGSRPLSSDVKAYSSGTTGKGYAECLTVVSVTYPAYSA